MINYAKTTEVSGKWVDNTRFSVAYVTYSNALFAVLLRFSLSMSWLTSDQQCQENRGGLITIASLSEVIWFLKYLEHQPNINPGNVYIFPVGCVFWVSEYQSLFIKSA